MSMDAESASPMWVSDAAFVFGYPEGEVEGEDGGREDGVGEVVERPGAGGE